MSKKKIRDLNPAFSGGASTRFLEYKNTGKGGNLQNKRIKWAKTLTEKQAKKYTKENVLGKDF